MLSATLRSPICRALATRTPLYPARFKVTPVLQLFSPTIRSQPNLHVAPSAAMTADRSRSASLDGTAEWPCKAADLEAGQQFLQTAAKAGGRIVLAPDKDADGLSAGAHKASAGYQPQHCQADGKLTNHVCGAHVYVSLLGYSCAPLGTEASCCTRRRDRACHATAAGSHRYQAVLYT